MFHILSVGHARFTGGMVDFRMAGFFGFALLGFGLERERVPAAFWRRLLAADCSRFNAAAQSGQYFARGCRISCFPHRWQVISTMPGAGAVPL